MTAPDDTDSERSGAASPLALLRRNGLEPKRSLGQNFLLDARLSKKIADTASANGGASVLEIGAGTGALTAPLLAAGCNVVAIETDAQLSRLLRESFAAPLASGQLRLIEADVREVDLLATLDGMPAPRTLAGNLPYHLSGLLLRHAVDVADRVVRSVFLLQLEVVDRLCAAAGSEAYGALSVFAQAVYAPERAFVVKRGAFYPQPNVDSAVVVLEPLPRRVELSDEFTALVRAAFEKRRKTLRNAWRGVLGLTPDRIEAGALAAGIDLGKRGEVLAVADFERMALALRGGQGAPA
ncbi:MAG TPA: 16S rRNA (adenine(1518)-N(6)/adenine(1519)-N(6))-dimethyltransferase RsmA [Polyangiaceae bacterium]|nr:16S rRNA (adenine(1518)-N(6)/adenine(1519)-N(6))-dimethyltransferase RsmA [Polyangiaceae bacterium]